MSAAALPPGTTVQSRAYTVAEVAVQLAVSYESARVLIAEGKLAALKIGRQYRVPHEVLEQYLRTAS